MEAAMVERAALVALLRLTGARWAEVALDIQETGSATTVLEQRLARPETLFPDSAIPGAATATSLIRTAADDIACWTGQHHHNLRTYKGSSPSDQAGWRLLALLLLFLRDHLRCATTRLGAVPTTLHRFPAPAAAPGRTRSPR